MSNELRMTRNLIAAEASLVANLSEYFGNKVPSIISGFTEVAHSVVENILGTTHSNHAQVVASLTSDQKAFLKALRSLNYVAASNVLMNVPEGLSVPYRVYIDSLVAMVSFSEKLPQELAEFNQFISRLISDENYQLSTDYVRNKLFTITEDVDKIVETSSQCFKKGATVTQVPLGKVVSNNAEWESVIEGVNDLTSRITNIDKAKLKKLITESESLLNIFIPKIKRGEFKNISPKMVEKMADYTYMVAKGLEVYSVTYFRVLALEAAVTASLKKLTDIAEKEAA